MEIIFTALDFYKNTGYDPNKDFSIELYDVASTPPIPASEGARLGAWSLPYDSPSDTVSVEFKVPNSYTFGTSMTVDAHILLERNNTAQGIIQLRLRADFRSSGEQWGQGTTDTKYKQTVISSETTVNEPTGLTEAKSARHYKISFDLPGIYANPGDFAILSFDRTKLKSGNYNDTIYLTVASIRYSV
ncbi:MAG: hypothetical protein ACOX3U_06945 [Christensenellales bacterium]